MEKVLGISNFAICDSISVSHRSVFLVSSSSTRIPCAIAHFGGLATVRQSGSNAILKVVAWEIEKIVRTNGQGARRLLQLG